MGRERAVFDDIGFPLVKQHAPEHGEPDLSQVPQKETSESIAAWIRLLVSRFCCIRSGIVDTGIIPLIPEWIIARDSVLLNGLCGFTCGFNAGETVLGPGGGGKP